MKSFVSEEVENIHTWQHDYINEKNVLASFDEYNDDESVDDDESLDDEEDDEDDGQSSLDDENTNPNSIPHANLDASINMNSIQADDIAHGNRLDRGPSSISIRSNDNTGNNKSSNGGNASRYYTQVEHRRRLQEQEPLRIPQHPRCPQLDCSMILNNLRVIAQQSPSLPFSPSPSPAAAPAATLTRTRTPDLLLRVARSEEIPLIPSDIDWGLLTSQLQSYPARAIGDIHGAYLLTSILRMDPPISIVREVLQLYPKACINMDAFYTACQFTTSKSSKSASYSLYASPSGSGAFSTTEPTPLPYTPTANTSTLNPVVQLLMEKTMEARRNEGIGWGMLAFLGDPRIRTEHAQYLLSSIPDALVDEEHGIFGVSPLDRMISGAFIHGETHQWIEKLKLALWTVKKGRLAEYTFGVSVGDGDGDGDNGDCDTKQNWKSSCVTRSATTPNCVAVDPKAQGSQFYPFHLLVKRLIHRDFKGTHFSLHSFLRTLVACARSHSSSSSNATQPTKAPFHQRDEDGNLPLHVILRRKCNTNLGTQGERKLVTFLLRTNRESVWTPDGIDGKLPLRLSIENGWPCYDIIVGASLRHFRGGDPFHSSSSIVPSNNNTSSLEIKSDHHKTCHHNQPSEAILHTILSGPYHQCFHRSGARCIIRHILKWCPDAARTPSSDGRLPLHVGIENGWPCHDILVSAAPRSLQTRDIKTAFYPFMIAAFSKLQSYSVFEGVECGEQHGEEGDSDDDLMQLSVVYELIRESPMLLHGLATKIPKEKGIKRTNAKNNSEHKFPSIMSALNVNSNACKEDNNTKTQLVESVPLHACKKRKL